MMSAPITCVFDRAPANAGTNRIWNSRHCQSGAPSQSDEALNVVFSGPDGRHCIAAPTPSQGSPN